MSYLYDNGFRDTDSSEECCYKCGYYSKDFGRCMNPNNHTKGKLCPMVKHRDARKKHVCNLFEPGRRPRAKMFLRRGAQSGKK